MKQINNWIKELEEWKKSLSKCEDYKQKRMMQQEILKKKAKINGYLTKAEEDLKELEKLIFTMQQSRDCFGYQKHKVFTTNLIYKFDIEPPKCKFDKRILDFAMGCYKNGWLEAVNQLEEIEQNLTAEIKMIKEKLK